MKRMHLLFTLIVAWSLMIAIPISCEPEPSPEGGEIGYINPNVPEVDTPEYPGKRYQALVPATLDLAERSALALNAFTETLNPNCDLEAYYWFQILSDPPFMGHSYSDHVRIKYLQAIPYLRLASGSLQNIERERKILRYHLMMQGPDGLVYTPMKGRPWGQLNESSGQWLMDAGVIHHPEGRRPEGDQVAVLSFDNGRMLGAFSVYASLDPEGPWREAATRLAKALIERITVDGDVAYLSNPSFTPGQEIIEPEILPMKYTAAVTCQTAHGLAQYDRLVEGRVTQATEIAAKMIRYIYRDSEFFAPDGTFLNKREGDPNVHFHTHTMVLLAALEIAEMTQDNDLLEMSRKVYAYARGAGDSTVGYFQEHLNEPLSSAETCEIADMIMAAIKFSHIGIDKWDDADRWIRNQFAENQMTDWRFLRNCDFSPSEAGGKSEYTTTKNVHERTLGFFAYWPSPNDYFAFDIKKHPASQSGCCTANGGKALGFIWKSMIDFDEGELRVHLLMNRASKWADIDSHIPYRGQADVKAKQDLELEVRIPEWVTPGEVTCQVDGSDRSIQFEERYAKIGSLKSGETASFHFPIEETNETLSIQGSDYCITKRGNTVVHINPQGKIFPLYQRAFYRTGKTHWLNKERFETQFELEW